MFPLRFLVLVFLSLTFGSAPAGASAEVDPPEAHVLTQALFAGAAQGPWQPVALPDTWRARGVPPGRGFYRASFELVSVPTGMWAMRFERLSTHHEVRVNGQLVSGGLPGPTDLLHKPVPVLIGLPPTLLRAGANTIEIAVDTGIRAGLSPIDIGPNDAAEQEFLSGYHLNVTLPQMLNVASGGVCLLMLALWWRRRSEVAVGSFALMGLLTSARNVGYYRVATEWPVAFVDYLFFAAQVVSVVLLGVFAMAVSERRPRFFGVALGWCAGVLLLVGALAASAEHLNLARALAYPVLLLIALQALWLVFRRVREMRAPTLLGLLGGVVVLVVAGVHDYLYQQGHISVMHAYWLPYAVPVALVAYASVMMQRMVGALNQVEGLNQTLEQRVRERTHDLQIANTAKTRFLAAASHDLRQPVVTIGLLVGLLREQIAEPALRAMVGKVDEAVAAMESLLAGLLDLSRLDSARARPRLRSVALQPLFDAIESHEAEAALRKGLRLRIRPTPLAVQGDPVLLEQALRNLVSNALRYTDAGGVLLGARRRGGQVLLQVWDSGRGIAPDQQELVFEEFVQLDNPQRERSRGLGIGLAIVRRSAALLGAQLALASTPGRGSCFALTLARADAGATQRPPPEPGEPSLEGQTVVLVEDDTAVRDALIARLTAWGAKVLAFAAPHELNMAVNALAPAERRATLLITDQRLPGGSGTDVVEFVRRRFGALPVLVVTGNTAPHEIAALGASGLRVLHKPFRTEELRAAIRAVLGS